MVVRELIRCLTCGCPITLRISVGHNPYQEHAFLCPNCMEEITAGLEVDVDDVRTALKFVENCDQGEDEGVIVNLSPHFVIAAEDAHEDQTFGWMPQAEYLLKLNDLAPPPDEEARAVFFDVYESLGGIPNLTMLWRTVRKAWSLTRNQRLGLAETTLKAYKPAGYDDESTLANVLFDFCGRLLIPQRIEVLHRATEQLGPASQREPAEYTRFRDYYLGELQSAHMDRYYDIFSEYFRDFTEYDQTILYAKNGAEVPDGCVATSNGFRHTKMFYGNAFENYTANLTILACLNNILEGRPFDEFRDLNLKQYLTINKANRGRPFEHREEFAVFLTCLDSTLRNASHHGAMNLIDHRRVIEYQSGGTGAKKVISYSKYLGKCNQIMLSSAALLMVELLIAS
jgi:hypothetical protein